MGQPAVKTQPGEKRTKNFHEVSLGYPKKLAVDEATRCPQCTDPVCMRGCPLEINIPGFIRMLREGNVSGAYQTIREQNCLPSICGRICSAPCEAACFLTEDNGSIGIRALERYAADHGKAKAVRKDDTPQRNGKVAIVGSGPSGLSAATELAKKGYKVTIFESLDKPGGVLRYGIPEFRIPKKILDHEINEVKALGVEIETNFFIGRTATIEDLFEREFLAVLLAMGAGIPKFYDLPGSNLGGVYYGEEFLMRVNLNRARQSPNFFVGPKVAVIGSGNTALDCARAAKRFGRDVTLVFRRTEDDMRVRKEERQFGKEEGIKFESLVKPTELVADQNNFVRGINCIRMDFADENESGDWKIEPVPESDFVMDVDTVIIAIGHRPNSLIGRGTSDITLSKDETINVDAQTGMTNMPGVFACGNVVTNAGPVVEAIASGKKSAEHIDAYIKSKSTVVA